MTKCSECRSATHRAIIRKCPDCGTIQDYHELLTLLEELGLSDPTLDQIKMELKNKEVADPL